MLPLMGWQAFQGPLSPEMLEKMRSIRFCVMGIFVAAVGRFATGDPPITELLCGITGVFLLKDDENLAACYNCLMSTPLENCAGPSGGGFGCLQSFLFISGFNSFLMLLNLSSGWQQGMSHGGPFSLLSLIFQGLGAVYAWRLSTLVTVAQAEQGGSPELLRPPSLMRRFARGRMGGQGPDAGSNPLIDVENSSGGAQTGGQPSGGMGGPGGRPQGRGFEAFRGQGQRLGG